jgi:hypothetical protein
VNKKTKEGKKTIISKLDKSGSTTLKIKDDKNKKKISESIITTDSITVKKDNKQK